MTGYTAGAPSGSKRCRYCAYVKLPQIVNNIVNHIEKVNERLSKAIGATGSSRAELQVAGYEDLAELARCARKTLEYIETEFQRRTAPRSADEIIADMDAAAQERR